MNNIKIAIIERQILHLFFDHPEYLDTKENFKFFSTLGNDFYIILLTLLKDDFKINSENVLTHSNNTFSLEVLETILSTEYEEDKFLFYIRELQKAEMYENLTNSASNIIQEIHKENKDLTGINKSVNDIKESLNNLLVDKTHNYLEMKNLLEEHKETIVNRLNGEYHTSGDVLLDKVLGGRLQGGVAILAANSGMGKSTLAIYWAMLRLIKNLPTFVVNTELSREGWMDNILPSLLKDISYDDLSNTHKESFLDPSHVKEQIEELERRMETRQNFLMYPHSFLTLDELQTFIIESRLQMKLSEKTPLFGIVDLLSMIKEFSVNSGGNRADNIELAMNQLNAFCLEHNTFLLGTTQLKRKDKAVSIETEEDLLAFKPTLESIKSSSSYEERARWVLGLYAPYRVVRKNQCNPIIRDMVPPITTITVLKDSYNRQEGLEINYVMDIDKKMFMPYYEEEKIE